MDNADYNELRKFDDLAHRWWDPEGEFRPLHDINPIRLEYIERHTSMVGKQVVDVGCGGGILAEGMAARGAEVTGIDMAAQVIAVAKQHAEDAQLAIDYRVQAAESLAAEAAGQFDIVTCMELLEHVPDPRPTIAALATLAKPGGHVFLSTINRTPKAFMLAIVGAEYILRLLPRGTHDYAKLIRPAELDHWCRDAHLTAQAITGMAYNPILKTPRLTKSIDVNYLMYARRD